MQANTDKDVATAKAGENASVLITQAEGKQRIVVNEVRAQTVTKINQAKTSAQKMLINTEQEIAVMAINAQTEFEQAKAKYAALTQECSAEEANLGAINAQREHDYQMNRAAAYEALGEGKNTKIVMSGQSGEHLIQKIFDLAE